GPYALAPQFPRPGLDHADHAELARRVVGLSEIAVETDDGGAVQYHAGVLLQHGVEHRLRAVEDALEIDVDDVIELLVGHVLDRRILDDAGIVDEAVDPAVAGHYGFRHAGEARLVADVDLQPYGLAPRGRDFLRGLLRQIGVDVAGDDLGALGAELDRGRLADAPARAGDDRDLARKPSMSIQFHVTPPA